MVLSYLIFSQDMTKGYNIAFIYFWRFWIPQLSALASSFLYYRKHKTLRQAALSELQYLWVHFRAFKKNTFGYFVKAM
jgi:hypothetical protein